jgi:hypothetical protein
MAGFCHIQHYFEMHHLGIDAPQPAARMPSPSQTNPTKRLRVVSSFTAMTEKAPSYVFRSPCELRHTCAVQTHVY